jgi:hypothetical protein
MYNSVGVRNYPDYETGIQATARTLTNGYYPRTLAGLQSNAPMVDDGEMGVWGTGGEGIRAQLAIAPENGAHEATGGIVSNPIAIAADDCGWNVAAALEANGGALQSVRLAPGDTFSFNATMGDPASIDYRTCAGVPGGNWCNLAARYAQVARALGTRAAVPRSRRRRLRWRRGE